MKYLEKYQLVKLEDDKQYVVIDSTIYKGDNYVYMINVKDLKDQLVGLVSNYNNHIKVNILDSKSKENKIIIDRLSTIFVNNIIEGV